MKYLQKRNRFLSIYCYRINIRARIWQLDGGWRRASAVKWYSNYTLFILWTAYIQHRWHRAPVASALLLVVGYNRFRIGHLSQCIDFCVNRNKRIRCNGPGMIYVTEACCSNRASIYLVASNTRLIQLTNEEIFLVKSYFYISLRVNNFISFKNNITKRIWFSSYYHG